MDKSWNKLAERCSLFFDAPDGLYKELLKEAECELANKCNLVTMRYSYNLLASSDYRSPISSLKLPSVYKEMVSVWVNSNLIAKQEDEDWSYTEGTYGMVKNSGTPDAYTVYNGFISFNSNLNSTDVVDIKYKGNLPNDPNLAKTVLCRIKEKSISETRVFVDTTLGKELNGASMLIPANKTEFGYWGEILTEDFVYQGDDTVAVAMDYLSNANDVTDPYPTVATSDWIVDTTYNQHSGQIFKCASLRGLNAGGGGGDLTDYDTKSWVKGKILRYRNYAPVIENDYHLDLCDYAIYIASVKTNPELSMKHQQIWEKRIREALNDNLDRELSYSIKGEI